MKTTIGSWEDLAYIAGAVWWICISLRTFGEICEASAVPCSWHLVPNCTRARCVMYNYDLMVTSCISTLVYRNLSCIVGQRAKGIIYSTPFSTMTMLFYKVSFTNTTGIEALQVSQCYVSVLLVQCSYSSCSFCFSVSWLTKPWLTLLT